MSIDAKVRLAKKMTCDAVLAPATAFHRFGAAGSASTALRTTEIARIAACTLSKLK